MYRKHKKESLKESLFASAQFRYSPDLTILIRAQYNAYQFAAPISAWDKIHEAIVKQLQAFEYTPPLSEEEEKP